MERLARIARKLSDASVKRYNNPYEEFQWPQDLPMDQWHFAPELISLYGLEEYAALDEQQQKQLAFWEAVNFFGINIHGEKALIGGLAEHLYYMNWSPELSEYLHHFLDEENKHMTVFGTFCHRYGKKVYADKKMALPRDYAKGEADFLFFAKVVIFEELVDHYNMAMGKDERLHPLVQHINQYHHNDESRHLAFGRELSKSLFEQWAPTWNEQTLAGVQAYLSNYIVSTWREYYNPAVYADAGFDNSYALYQKAWSAPACRAHREAVSANCIDYFLEHGMMTERPAL
ncbi:MAG: diiron oxygenase [Pseudomonadota bacterium]|nr:diiron oxygenase [Pseudomonadota bacterium]